MGKSTYSNWQRYALWGLAGAAFVGSLAVSGVVIVSGVGALGGVGLILGVVIPLIFTSAAAAAEAEKASGMNPDRQDPTIPLLIGAIGVMC